MVCGMSDELVDDVPVLRDVVLPRRRREQDSERRTLRLTRRFLVASGLSEHHKVRSVQRRTVLRGSVGALGLSAMVAGLEDPQRPCQPCARRDGGHRPHHPAMSGRPARLSVAAAQRGVAIAKIPELACVWSATGSAEVGSRPRRSASPSRRAGPIAGRRRRGECPYVSALFDPFAFLWRHRLRRNDVLDDAAVC
jgi:hypothetical protein